MDCIFCEIAKGNIPGKVVFEDDDVIAFLDVNPVSVGHTLVVPKTHCANIMECEPALVGKVFGVASALAKRIQETLGADGINILSNAGEAAGQTVNHFHVHIIPRYEDKEKDKLTFEFGKVDADLDEVLKQIEG